MKSRVGRKVLAILAVAALVMALLPAGAFAGVAGTVNVQPANPKAGAVTSYAVEFTVDQAVYSGDQIAVIFPAGFGESAATVEKVTVGGSVYSFSPQHPATGVWTLYYTGTDPNPIPANVRYAVYFAGIVNPTTVGSYYITVRAPYPSDTGAKGSVTIDPADPVKLVIKGLTDEDPGKEGIQVRAGSQQNIGVVLVDRYGNEGAVNNTGQPITVKLSDTDAQANFGTEQTVTVTIAQNASQSGTAAWTPKTAGAVSITATDVTQNPNPQMQGASVTVQVVAASPNKIVLGGPSYLDKDAEGTYTVSLRDAYGNPATVAQAVYVGLTAEPGQGVTFTPSTVEIPAGQNTGSFKFKSSQADMYTITASAPGLVSGQAKVAVGVTVLAELQITAPQTGEVGIASEITITLKDQFGDAFAAPDGGVAVTLGTDKGGTFYNAPANGTAITSITIPKGQSSVKVYYVPGTDAVGAHKLTFTASQVLSDGRPIDARVTAETTLNVGTGAELWLDVSLPILTAGQRGEVTITVKDGHGNDVPAGPNGRVVYLETESPTGKFYATAEGGDPITQVTIPAGQASAKVYYVDTESWTKKAMAGWPEKDLPGGHLSSGEVTDRGLYSYTVAFRSEGVIGYSGKAVVNPAEAKAITLDIARQSVDAVPDEDLTQIGSKIGATDLIGIAYMLVGVVDQYGNPVPQNALLRISVKDDSPSAFLWWDYAELENGEWAQDWQAWLYVTAPGTYKVTATAGGLSGAEKQVTFEQPSLVIEAPDTALPDTRVPVTVKLTNLWASGRDLTVNLGTSTENSAFYADEQTADPMTTATIKAYNDSITVYLESDDPLGTTLELTASIPDLNLTAKATITLGRGPDFVRTLSRGWNVVSTPWVLAEGKNTIDKILANPDYIELAYGYADGKFYEVKLDDPASLILRPLEAMFVKLKGQTEATFWAQPGLGTPPVRDLVAGWNLVGNPAVNHGGTPTNEALSSIAGSYAVVISPAGCNQTSWVYTPQTPGPESYRMEPFCGYWVYMTKADRLAGQAMPPLR